MLDDFYARIVSFMEIERDMELSWMSENQAKILYPLLGYNNIVMSWMDGPLLNCTFGDVEISLCEAYGVVQFMPVSTDHDLYVAVYTSKFGDNYDDPARTRKKTICAFSGTDGDTVTQLSLQEKMFHRKLNRYFDGISSDYEVVYNPRIYKNYRVQ